jgi:hypothetical protein
MTVNGQELFNVGEIAAELKTGVNAIYKKVSRRGIKPVYYKTEGMHRVGYYTREQIDQMAQRIPTGPVAKPKPPKQPKAPKPPKVRRIKNYWKLSVYSDDIGFYVIKNCCLSKTEASARKKELKAQGLKVRISKHIETEKQQKSGS